MNRIFDNILHAFHTPFTNSVLTFSLILFIILLVPLIFNRFKIPGIIGLIISGTVIGPHGLFLIDKNAAVDLFSTIGLLYIMFIAGLELDLGEFRKNKNKSILFGLLTFIIPIAFGLPVCFYLLQYGFNTSLLTASMFATHTLIAYPIVNRLGISKNQAVAIAVGGTIFTDTAVLLLLAIISGANETGLTQSFWTGLIVSLVIFLVIVVFVIPKISSWFFRRMEDEKYAHFIFVLSVVFFCAFLAELSGLEPIIGAFAAGLTLNRLIPHTSTLMNRIEFVGNSLFIPFFLISVGMIIDIKVLTNGPQAILVALTLTIVALLAKWIAAHLTGLAFKFSGTERNLIFGLSSAHAAATLAVILVGYRIGLIDDNILNGTVVLILITCIVASFFTERAGKKLLLQMDSHPASVVSSQRFLVPINNPKTMEKLIDFAIVMKYNTDISPIVALTVVNDDDQAQAKLLESKKLLDKAIIHAASAEQQIEITATIDRNVTSGIMRVIKEKFITDIVIGWSDDKTLVDKILGKTFDGLVKHTTQNIYVTRFPNPLNVQRTIVLVCPVFAERENGFYGWLVSVLNAAFHLRMNIDLYASVDVKNFVTEFIAEHSFTVEVNYKNLLDYGKMSTLKEHISPNHMLAFVCAREGGVSYNPVQDILLGKIAKLFTNNNLVFIYPATNVDNVSSNYTQEVTGEILEKSLSLWRSVRRMLGRNP
jgi:Kef-type K+ transport system membrane component KefB